MKYIATDRWHDEHIEHGSRANHRYYMKVGDGPNARYFYSAQEYAAYRSGSRSRPSQSDIRSRYQQQKANTPKKPGMLSRLSNAYNTMRNNANARDQRAKSDTQMRNLRRKQAERLNTQDRANNARLNRGEKNDTKRNVGPMEKSQARKAVDAKKGRYKAFNDAYRSRSTESDRRAKAYQRNQMQSDRAEMVEKRKKADANRHYKQAKKDSMRRANNNMEILPGLSKRNAKRIVNRTKTAAEKTAKKTVRTAKKAWNSSTAKSARKQVKKTANSAYKSARKQVKKTANRAYNRGRSYLKKLFGR